MSLIILENVDGKRRMIVPGRQIRPPRSPGEKIVGIERPIVESDWMSLHPKLCSGCGQKGVYEST